MKRTRWSIRELSKVLEIASKDAVHPSNFSARDIFRTQEIAIKSGALGPDRRRKTFSPKFLEEFRDELSKIRSRMSPVQLVPILPPEPEKNPLEQAIEQLSSIVEKIIAPIIEKTVIKKISELHDSIKSITKPVEKPEKPAIPDQPIKKQRILIVGLREDQQSRVVTEFDDVFQLSFYKDKGSHRDLRNKSLNSDRIFLMTKFINHSQQTNVLLVARNKTEFINGGESELYDKLTALFVNA